MRVDGVKQPVAFYTLDVIISVGYRVKSKRGTDFRRWATGILKEYLLHGYAVNNRFEQLEHRMYEAEEKINFFVRTSLPPVERIFYDGQIFDAYRFASDLVRKAKKSVVLIDDEVYHIGASLKDLGKKWFAFTLLHDIMASELLNRIGKV